MVLKTLIARKARSILIRISPLQMGYVIKPKGSGYFDAGTIIKSAEAQGLSVCDYLELNNIGGVGKRRDFIISKLHMAGVMQHCDTIVEIGSGTGMYLEKFLEICQPKKYEVYETNVGWTAYLKRKYSASSSELMVHNADGSSLGYTPDASADMVLAHGVFVYLSLISTFEYLQEAVRVCKPGGYIIFDCFTNKIFTLTEIQSFKAKNQGFDWPVVICEDLIADFCLKYNLRIDLTFNVNYHNIYNTYYILQKM